MTLEERWEIWGQWIEQEQTKLRESTKDLEGFVMDNLPSTQKIMEGVQKRVDKALKDFEQFCLEVLQEALPPHALRGAKMKYRLTLHAMRALPRSWSSTSPAQQRWWPRQPPTRPPLCKLMAMSKPASCRGGGGIG